jgi:hypothetical protein
MLAILAAIFGVCLMAGGAYAIGLVVWGYTSFPDEPEAVSALFLFAPLGALAIIGGVLLLRRLLRRPN